VGTEDLSNASVLEAAPKKPCKTAFRLIGLRNARSAEPQFSNGVNVIAFTIHFNHLIVGTRYLFWMPISVINGQF
jgi:hypothetical protein